MSHSPADAVQPQVSDDTARQGLAALQQTVKDLQAAQQRAAEQISDLQRQLSAEQSQRELLSEQVAARLPQPAKKRSR